MTRGARELLSSEDAELRRQGVARAAAAEADFELVFAALSDDDWRVRKEAVRALCEWELSAARLARLVQLLLPGDHVGQRNAAVQALGAHGEAAVAALAPILDELDADGLKLAIEAFALTQHASAMPWLRRLSAHADPNVRAAAIEAVASVGQVAPDAAAVLLEQALDEPDPFLRLVTLDVIRRLDLAPSWERLRELLHDPVLSSTGLELAARLGEPLSAPHFVSELERVLVPRAAVERHREGSEPEARAIRHLARFLERSQEALLAGQSALHGLSPAARKRLLQLCESHPDHGTCRDALVLLAAAGDDAVAPLALARLEDEALAGAAHRAIELLGGAMTEVLIGWLALDSDRKRATAVGFLAAIAEQDRDSPARAALRALEDGSPRVMRAWVEAMVRLRDEDGMVRALSWFDGEQPQSVRRSARLAALALAEQNPARAAEFTRGVQAGDARAEGVCWLLSVAPEPLRAERDDARFLVAATSNPAVAVRVAALSALGQRGRTEAIPAEALDAMVFALSDESFEVQSAAIQALGRVRDVEGGAPGTALLVALARKHPDSELELEALRALGQTGDSAALQFLVARVRASSSLVAVAAIEALGAFDPRRFLETLTEALRHADPEVVKAALQALARLQDLPESAVVACLSHSVWDVRRLAADVLGSHPSVSAREALARHLAAEGESVVREAIVRSLGRYEPPGSLRTIPPPGQFQPE